MKSIVLTDLLKIMSKETFHRLKTRGRIVVLRNAPNTVIDAECLPNHLQEALSRLPIA